MVNYIYNENNLKIRNREMKPKRCYDCKGKIEDAVKLINYKGRSTLINTFKCVKCGATFTPLKEAEKARLELNPRFFERIKQLFSGVNKFTEVLFKGKVL